MDLKKKTQKTKMQQFYQGKVIFLTGGTGFLGKVLLEKLLRSCPSIGHIYLLVREKHGLSSEERLKVLLEDTIFSRLKNEIPDFAEKLTVVHGELHRPKLGLSEHHAALLCQNVDIVLHSAATLRFNERLKVAISTNVYGTKQVCLLAQNMVKLEAFVYVSTAFTNCDSPIIPERVCQPSISPDTLIQLSELLDDYLLHDITPSIIGPKPNTYIYTKNAAEEIVNKFRTTMRVAVLRPSIVVAALSEPQPGWLNSTQGPGQVVTGVSAGLLRTILCEDLATAHMVPVDYTVNAILALTYSVATQQWQGKEIPVVNIVPSESNSITWGQFGDLVEKYVRVYPSLNLVWYPFLCRTRSLWMGRFQRGLLHLLPAKILDFLAERCGRPGRLQQAYSHLDKYAGHIKYFCCRHFQFQDDNQRLLWESLEPQDQLEFPFDMSSISWEQLMEQYIQGCRLHLLKEQPDTVVRARRRLSRLYAIHVVTKTSLLLVSAVSVWFVCGRLYNVVRECEQFVW